MSVAAGSVLEIQYLYPPTGVKFSRGWRACATYMYSLEGVDGQGLDD